MACFSAAVAKSSMICFPDFSSTLCVNFFIAFLNDKEGFHLPPPHHWVIRFATTFVTVTTSSRGTNSFTA
jgi:hypothetical protein